MEGILHLRYLPRHHRLKRAFYLTVIKFLKCLASTVPQEGHLKLPILLFSTERIFISFCTTCCFSTVELVDSSVINTQQNQHFVKEISQLLLIQSYSVSQGMEK